MRTPAFPTVLVPLDGSGLAEQALAVAAAIVRRTGAMLHLATVQVPMAVLAPGPEELAVDVGVPRELREQVQAYLASAARAISTHCTGCTSPPPYSTASRPRRSRITPASSTSLSS